MPREKRLAEVRTISNIVDDDTINAISELHVEALRGKLVGIAFVALYRDRTYVCDATGEVKRFPTHGRGMVAALDDTLKEYIDTL